MKAVYPVIMKKTKEGYYVNIPDFQTGTQGIDLADAMYMARDAIGIMGIDLEDEGMKPPQPGTEKCEIEEDEFEVLIDVDFWKYRRESDSRAIRKNCTIPYWLSVEADKVHINYSKVLKEALIEELNL